MPATPVARQRSPSTKGIRPVARQNSPSSGPSRAYPRKSSPSAGLPAAPPRKNSPGTPENSVFQPFWACRANFFALTPTIRPSRANFFAHRTQTRTNFETNDASAATDAGQYETADTTATEKCTKYSFFSPAKAMAVSIGARPAHAKTTEVSDNRPSWPTGPGCGTRGWRRGLAGQHTDNKPRRCGGRRRTREGLAAVPVGGGGAWPGFEATRPTAHQPRRPHWCGGRRRDRRARAGFEARRRTK